MPRDPDTGEFISEDDLESFERIEEVNEQVHLSVPASGVGGQTDQGFGQEGTFEGLLYFNLEDILDRDEIAVLLWAEHRLWLTSPSTQTADGTVSALMELSASPEASAIADDPLTAGDLADIADTGGDFTVEHDSTSADTGADTVGRPLNAIAHSPFSEGAGAGGGGTPGDDEWVGQPYAEPVFDIRDDLFVNGYMEHNNISDASLYARITSRHVWGVQHH